MPKKSSCIIFFSLFLYLILPGQPVQFTPNRNVIIDCDAGISDFRAILLLLSRPELSVKGILVTDGIVDPENGQGKVKSLLKELGKDAIPSGSGKTGKNTIPSGRSENLSFRWGDSPVSNIDMIPSLSLLTRILEESVHKITYVCLGPLTSFAEMANKRPDLLEKIDRIIWYNDSARPFRGFNYESDSTAAKKVFASGTRIDLISNLGNENAVFDMVPGNSDNVTDKAGIIDAPGIRTFKPDHFSKKNLLLSDELVAIYLFNPSLFDVNPLIGKTRIRFNTGYDLQAVREVIMDMISGHYHPDENIVFTRFPSDRRLFTYDVRQIMDSAISRYGKEEWKACVLTDEFHGHLGVYSIVGAKMGIKARELFGVGPDVLKVVSHAGIIPPYSCLNDGIQVSTGSTLGMGLISVADGRDTKAMADFMYNGRTIRIGLKPEYLMQVEKDINEGIVRFGLMDDGYWKMVRQSALRYWLEWDRNLIFNVEEIIP